MLNDLLGCLLHYLRKNQFKLNSPEMTDMVSQVAGAMEYLEKKNFIHRDLVGGLYSKYFKSG